MKKFRIYMQDHMTSFRSILLGFFLLILIGAFVLSLPISSSSGQPTPFLDALFTSASATCVTGLILYDTASYWSSFGQFVILLFIQMGGLGVVTVMVATLLATGQNIGLLQRSAIKDAVSSPQIGGVVKMTVFILKMTFFVELFGAIALFFVFYPDFGIVEGMKLAIFHSISAFCNAGFDLLGVSSGNTSFMSYASNPLAITTLSALIVIGGLGFFTWHDIFKHHFSWKSYRLQTKVILSTTLILIVFPFLYFFLIEFQDVPILNRILVSLFQSITPRTAGFNTVSYSDLSESGLLLTIILMLIGGAPGSTAGGIKTTTIFVLLLSSFSYINRKEEVNCFKRRIDDTSIHNAMTVLAIYLMLLLAGGILLSSIEQIPILHALFECASALGTVGLSVGITSQLSAVSKCILLFFMYFGRVGAFTLAYATVSFAKRQYGKLPVEKIIIG